MYGGVVVCHLWKWNSAIQVQIIEEATFHFAIILPPGKKT